MRNQYKRFTKEIVNKKLAHRNIKLVGKYINSRTRTLFRCINNHQWETLPGSVLHGSSCPYCLGKILTKKIINNRLEHRNIKNTNVFKIGITNRTVMKRFNDIDLKKIIIVKTWYYKVGKDALKIEQFILNHYKKFKYTNEPLLESGNTELFNCNVLGL
jgi:hypothetical protein